MKRQTISSLLLGILPVLLFPFVFTDQTWQSIADHARIQANGFHAVHPLHADIPCVYADWLTSVLFGKLFALAGKAGVIVFCCLLFVGLLLMLHKTCRMLGANTKLAGILTFVCGGYMFLSPTDITMLPFWFALLCAIDSLWLLFHADHIATKAAAFVSTALFSLLLVNLQGMYWFLLLVLVLGCFVCVATPYLIGKSKNIQDVALALFILLFVALTACVTPYGTDLIRYMQRFWNGDFASYTMQTPDIKLWSGKLMYSFLLIVAAILYLARQKAAIKMLLAIWLICACFVTILDQSQFMFFIFCAAVFLSTYLKEICIPIPEKIFSGGVCAVLAILLLIGVPVHIYRNIQDNAIEELCAPMQSLAAEYTADERQKLSVFTQKTHAGYLSYLGFSVYYDRHIYWYLPDNKPEEDEKDTSVNAEYLAVVGGRTHLMDFYPTYAFDYLYLKNQSLPMAYVEDFNLLHETLRYTVKNTTADYTLFEKQAK